MKHKLIKFVSFGVMAIVSFSTIFSGLASAAYYGAGTSANPYRITDCSDLQNINNNLSADYVIVANIDCTSVGTFTSIAGFTGTLDGQDHSIKNIDLSGRGLFTNTSGATIENINIISGSLSIVGNYVGSIVGTANNTTLTNVHSSMTISVPLASYWGGLVGQLEGTSTLSQSSYSGTFTGGGGSYYGELVGSFNNSGTISDSFATGTLNTSSAYEGPIVGFMNGTTTINQSYAAATVNLNGYDYDGGFAGLNNGAINNSFAASTLVGTNTLDNGFVGADSMGTYANDYFDQYLAGTSNCLNYSGICTAVNSSNSTPNYFKDNSTNGPFSTWDFNNVWETTSGYPTLRALSGFNAPSGIPNNGDANGDGVIDSYEANVLDLESTSGNWVNITVPSSSGCSLGNGQSLADTTKPADPGYTRLTDFLDFDAYCLTPGTTIQVTLIYSRLIDTTGAVLLFYNSNTQSYSVVNGAVFSTVNIGGNSATEVSYSITDGGTNDLSGVANGLIEDPVIIATPTTSAPNTGYGSPSNMRDLYILLSLALTSLSLGFALLYWHTAAKKAQ